MKKDGYKITVTTEYDCMPKWVQVYYPVRKFKNLQEILDYAINRRFNPKNTWDGLKYVYSRVLDPADLVFKGYLRTIGGDARNLRVSVRIENIVYCNYCDSVFPKYEYPELRSGFELKHLSCRECGEKSMRLDQLPVNENFRY